MFSWFATSLVFYGLILNVGNLAGKSIYISIYYLIKITTTFLRTIGDPFVNTAISSSMDVVAAASIYILIRYIPKRKLLSAAYVLAGTSCLGSMFFQQMSEYQISTHFCASIKLSTVHRFRQNKRVAGLHRKTRSVIILQDYLLDNL